MYAAEMEDIFVCVVFEKAGWLDMFLRKL